MMLLWGGGVEVLGWRVGSGPWGCARAPPLHHLRALRNGGR